MLRFLPLLLVFFASPSLAAGWPGGKRTLSTSATGRGVLASADLTRSLSVVGDLAGTSDILALELNQAGDATTALCSLKWEALQ